MEAMQTMFRHRWPTCVTPGLEVIAVTGTDAEKVALALLATRLRVGMVEGAGVKQPVVAKGLRSLHARATERRDGGAIAYCKHLAESKQHLSSKAVEIVEKASGGLLRAMPEGALAQQVESGVLAFLGELRDMPVQELDACLGKRVWTLLDRVRVAEQRRHPEGVALLEPDDLVGADAAGSGGTGSGDAAGDAAPMARAQLLQAWQLLAALGPRLASKCLVRNFRFAVQRLRRFLAAALLVLEAAAGAAAYVHCLATLLQQEPDLLGGRGVAGCVVRQLRVWWRGSSHAALLAELEDEVATEEQEAGGAAVGGGAALAGCGGGVLALAPMRGSLLPQLRALLPPESGVQTELLRLEKAISVTLLEQAAPAGPAPYLTCLVEEVKYFRGIGASQHQTLRLLSGGVAGRAVRQLRMWRRGADSELEEDEEEVAAAEEEEHGAAAQQQQEAAVEIVGEGGEEAVMHIGGLALDPLRIYVQQLNDLPAASAPTILAELTAWVAVLVEREVYRVTIAEAEGAAGVAFDEMDSDAQQQARDWQILLAEQNFPAALVGGAVDTARATDISLLDASRVTAWPLQVSRVSKSE